MSTGYQYIFVNRPRWDNYSLEEEQTVHFTGTFCGHCKASGCVFDNSNFEYKIIIKNTLLSVCDGKTIAK